VENSGDREDGKGGLKGSRSRDKFKIGAKMKGAPWLRGGSNDYIQIDIKKARKLINK